MKTNSIQISLTVAAFTLACNLQAQYTFDRFNIGGGGGRINGNTYVLNGTVGQSATRNLAGGSYALESGFWAGAFSPPTLDITRVGSQGILGWPGSGFVLQSADQAIGPWTDLSPGITTNGLHYQVHIEVNRTRKFFRLRAGQCIDFQTMPPMTIPPPWSFQGATFQTFDFQGAPSSPTIQARNGAAGSATGLDCDHQLVIDLATSCASVRLVLASSAHPAMVTTYNTSGAVTDTATMRLAGRLAPETLRLQGPGITKIVIDAPAQETLLLQLCCD